MRVEVVEEQREGLIAARDPWGVRPLVMGDLAGAPCFASESCAFDLLEAKPVRELEPGEVVDGLPTLVAECGFLFVGEGAVEVVVAESRVTAGGVVACLDFFGGGVRLVGVAGFQQTLRDVGVDVASFALPVWAVRTADVGAFVVVDAEPLHRIEELVVGLLGVTGGIGVFDAEDDLAVVVTGVRPVEQGGTHEA